MENQERKTSQRTRGKSYPIFGFTEAIRKAGELYKQEGKASVPSDVAVQAWGYAGLNGSSGRSLAAMKQYKLVEDVGTKTVRLSPEGLTILLEPEDSFERREGLRTCALYPAVFQDILVAFPDELPSDAAIISHLVRKEGFNQDAAGAVIGAFRDSISFLKSHDIPLRVQKVSQNSSENITSDVNSKARPSSSQSGAHQPQHEELAFSWPLPGDARVTIKVSRALTVQDIEIISMYLQTVKMTVLVPNQPD